MHFQNTDGVYDERNRDLCGCTNKKNGRKTSLIIMYNWVQVVFSHPPTMLRMYSPLLNYFQVNMVSLMTGKFIDRDMLIF